MATSQQVQELYIALLGRAADKPGLDWWLNNINGGERTLEEARAAFVTSEEFVDTYGKLQGAELVSAVYSNLFERTPSEEEVAYWVADGRPADQLVEAFLTYASPADQQVINNKVYVAEAYSVAAGDDYDLADAAQIIANVDGTVDSVTEALKDLPVSNATLTEELQTLQAAEKALADFVEENNYTGEEIAGAHAALKDKVKDYNPEDSAGLRDAKIADQQKALTTALNKAQAAVDKVPGLGKAVNNLVAAQQADEAASKAVEEAKINVTAAESNYVLNNKGAELTGSTDEGVTTVTDGDTTLFTVDADGKATLAKGVTEASKPGVTSLLDAVSARLDADNAQKATFNTLTNAEKAVEGLNGKELSDELIKAKADIADLDEAVAGLHEAVAVETAHQALVAEVDAAHEAFEALNVNLVTVDPDVGTEVELGTAGDDLFVFVGKDGDISSFGVLGEDRLFIGEGYTFNADVKAGDDSVLEVFFTQQGSNAVVTVESEVFGSNSSGLADANQIVLTGVNVADLSFDNGFVVAA